MLLSIKPKAIKQRVKFWIIFKVKFWFEDELVVVIIVEEYFHLFSSGSFDIRILFQNLLHLFLLLFMSFCIFYSFKGNHDVIF